MGSQLCLHDLGQLSVHLAWEAVSCTFTPGRHLTGSWNGSEVLSIMCGLNPPFMNYSICIDIQGWGKRWPLDCQVGRGCRAAWGCPVWLPELFFSESGLCGWERRHDLGSSYRIGLKFLSIYEKDEPSYDNTSEQPTLCISKGLYCRHLSVWRTLGEMCRPLLLPVRAWGSEHVCLLLEVLTSQHYWLSVLSPSSWAPFVGDPPLLPCRLNHSGTVWVYAERLVQFWKGQLGGWIQSDMLARWFWADLAYF